MKKLICVMALVCIGILLVSCGSNRPGDPKAQFIRDFGLHIDKKDCVLEELFNNYEGFPYEGIALYKLTVGEDARQAFLQWERLPFSEEAEHFLESLSAYVELPSIADGYWKWWIETRERAHTQMFPYAYMIGRQTPHTS